MNTYVQSNGAVYRGPFMKAPALKPAHYWRNTSALGAAPQRFVETPYPKD